MKPLVLAMAVACAGSVACSGNSSTAKDAPTGHSDAPHDTAPHVDSFVFKDAPPGTATLTVKNVSVWCNVTVGSGSASSGAEQMVNVPPSTVTLTATPISTMFILGDWHHTDGDTGTGDPGTVTGGTGGTSTAHVTVGSTAKCVWICCPFSDGSGCPTAEQCP